LNISNDRLAHLALILGVIGIAVIVILSYTIPAEAGERCYGIYCDRDDGDVDLEEQQEIWDNIQKDRNFISIQISKTCQLSGTCPTYKELADIWDNSNKYLSGDFYLNNETGLWERGEPQVYNVFEFYRFMNLAWVVWVDPDNYTWERSKQVIIQSSLVYQDPRDKFENQVRTEYVGLDIDGCSKAVIGWTNNGSAILNDVMNHFYSNCQDKLDYEPKKEIFIKSKIFEDCDKECFYHRELLQKELKVDFIISEEIWEESHCNDDDESKYSSVSNYERNQEECDRVRESLDLDPKDNGEPDCYGIYCDRDDDEVKSRQDRVKELQDIEDCKEEQTWDEDKIGGQYRRNLYDCNDEDERIEYFEILLCLESYDSEVNCDDDDERIDHLNETGVGTNSTSTKKEVKCYGIHCD